MLKTLLTALLLGAASASGAPTSVAVTCTFSFENDTSPLLTRHGCNASQGHGKAGGQNGFKLSVLGCDPLADFRALTVETKGRRASQLWDSQPQHCFLKLACRSVSGAACESERCQAFFSLPPGDAQRQLAVEHLAARPGLQQAVEDCAWSLLDAVQFVFNH
ncbi:MAG: hypothetical protein HZA92_10410 [Verrucomicrobia bacterium]|nr:hypothetical protein [Verrucomicrobiota bacterium]